MRFFFFLAIIGCAVAYSQTPPMSEAEMKAAAQAAAQEAVQKAHPQTPKPEPPKPQAERPPQKNIMAMQPSEVVALVDGYPVTAGALQAILGSVAPQMRQQAAQNPTMLLQQFGIMRRLAAEAERNKLDQQSPYKESLEAMRTQFLAQAGMTLRYNAVLISDEQAKARYEETKDRYLQARVKAIYIPFGAQAPQAGPDAPKPLAEAEAKAKAEQVVKEARGGADFVKLVKEYSKDPNSVAKDGDFGLVSRNAPISEEAKSAIFAAKVGEITDAIRQPRGFYVFRIEEFVTPPYEEAKSNVVEELKNTQFSEWIKAQQKDVKIEDRTSPAPPQPQQPAPAVK